MENQEVAFQTKPTPDILQIKPVEEIQVEKPPEKDLEVPVLNEEKQEIFIKPKEQKKPKRKLTDRQKAHMEKMRQAKARKQAEKKAKTKPVNIPPKNVDRPFVPPTQAPKPKLPQPVSLNREEIGQAYMNNFFNNMKTFMEVAQKIPVRQPPKAGHNASQTQSKPKPQPKPKPKPTYTDPYGVDLSTQGAFYKNYQNPFGY